MVADMNEPSWQTKEAAQHLARIMQRFDRYSTQNAAFG
jgi:hypothetical protein